MHVRCTCWFRRHAVSFLLVAVAGACSYQETSFPVRPCDVVAMPASAVGARPANTREWLSRAHRQLEDLLPPSRQRSLVTEDIVGADGRPIDILRHFKKYKSWMHTMIANAVGLSHTAQVTGDSSAIRAPAPPWEGFEDIWIPVDERVSLSARLGLAKSGGIPRVSDCIIILPGLLGDNMRLRSRDIAKGLVAAGFHVVSVELRGHGQTEARYPDVPYQFGVVETRDLLAVDEWLCARPDVRRTGMIAFSWSSNLALLAAWEDGRPETDPMISPMLEAHLPPRRTGKRHFEAGILAVSPSLRFEEVCDALDERRWTLTGNPIYASLQGTISWRAGQKGYAPLNGSLRELIRQEYRRSSMPDEAFQPLGYDYLRLLPYKDRPSGRKLEHARVPVLVIHAANDPLAYADEIGDFLAETTNPMVAAVILPGGGHDGFAAYCRSYFYSLVFAFFDPDIGAAACIAPHATAGRSAELPLATEIPASRAP